MPANRKRARRPGSGTGSGARSATGTTALLIRFERWYAQHAAGGGHEHPPVAAVAAQLTRLFELSRGRLHEPVVPVLESVLAEVEADDELASRLPEVIETLEHYLDFAVETGAWNGSDAQVEESAEFLEVAFDVATGLLLYLIDALDDVADVPGPQERAALGALAVPLRTPEHLADRVRTVLAEGDPSSVPGALAIERVLALLCVAAAPGLLPGATARQISALIDTAAGVSDREADEADAATERMLGTLGRDGILSTGSTGGASASGIPDVRPEAPAGLRAALADAVVDVADELGLLDDTDNPHPPGTVLEVEVALTGARPAAWRRLLLSAEADLGELHLAIQLAFDWDDSARHEFVLAGDPDEVFTAVDGDSDSDDSGSDGADETEVEVGELLVETGEELEYRYGADSEGAAERLLTIRLVRIRESADQTLPRVSAASEGGDVTEIDGLLGPLRLR